MLPRELKSLPVDLLVPMLDVRLGLLAAPVGFDTILIQMKNDANLIGLTNSLHLAVEDAVFG